MAALAVLLVLGLYLVVAWAFIRVGVKVIQRVTHRSPDLVPVARTANPGGLAGMQLRTERAFAKVGRVLLVVFGLAMIAAPFVIVYVFLAVVSGANIMGGG